jgi:hypothetical protein
MNYLASLLLLSLPGLQTELLPLPSHENIPTMTKGESDEKQSNSHELNVTKFTTAFIW